MLVLAIGDFHVPERAVGLPEKFKRLLQPRGKIQQVLCTGNVSNSPSSMEFLKSISPDFQMVKGDHDRNLWLPLSLMFKYGKLKVGLISGFEVVPKSDPLSLLAQARMMDVDILIYGSTHKVEAYTLDGKFFINPGSATGAFNSDSMDADDVEIIEGIVKQKNEVKKTEEVKKDVEETDNKPESTDTNNVEVKPEDGETTEKSDKQEVDKDNDEKADDGAGETPLDDEKHQEGSKEDENNEKAEEKKQEKEQENPSDTEEADKKLDTTEIEPYMDPIPSFCLLDLQGVTCTLYLYTLIDGDVKVDKLVYKKEESA